MPSYRILAAIALAASTLVCTGCGDTKTPTEPGVAPIPAAAASLAGIVTDENGVGRPGLFLACQTLYTTTNRAAPLGSYTLGGLTPGPTKITIEQEGVRDPASFAVTLAPGANVKNLTLARYHGEPASVTGIVIYAGLVIPNATVTLAGKSTVTDAGGRYSLAAVESGYWNIDVEWAPYYEGGFGVTLAPGPNVVDVRF